MPISEKTLISAGVQAGLINNDALADMRVLSRRERLSLTEVVTREGRFPASALYQAVAELRGIPYLSPNELKVDPDLLKKMPVNLMQRRLFLPVQCDGVSVVVMADPDDHVAIDSARRIAGNHIRPALTDPDALQNAVNRIFGEGSSRNKEQTDPTMLLDEIMKEAYLRRASDIHFEPEEEGMKVRYRADGHLQDFRRPLDATERDGVTTRIKVLSALDIAEQRETQDGSFTYKVIDWNIPEADIRVATVPTRWGERVTMRLLGQETADLSLEQLGMPDTVLQEFKGVINKPHGIVLVTGPTGSGKSTTLYAALRALDAHKLNILTVEDPVEQYVDGISQVQVTEKVGFAKALRSFLRHDPDVMLVGEIRDMETADIALKASLTGHLVLSTLHTNDAAGAVTRLSDIGCERYLVSSTLLAVIAQRLVRRLCPKCRVEKTATDYEAKLMKRGGETLIIWEPKGCANCLGTGYQGRTGLYEILIVDHALSQLIADGAGEDQIRREASRLFSLMDDGWVKVLEGKTSIEEVSRLNMGDG